jgi:hypothetical protein
MDYVERMPYSVFNKSAKAMVMLEAQEGIATIHRTNFSSFDDKTKDKIIGSLKESAEKFIVRPMLDYKDVVANLARKLRGG